MALARLPAPTKVRSNAVPDRTLRARGRKAFDLSKPMPEPAYPMQSMGMPGFADGGDVQTGWDIQGTIGDLPQYTPVPEAQYGTQFGPDMPVYGPPTPDPVYTPISEAQYASGSEYAYNPLTDAQAAQLDENQNAFLYYADAVSSGDMTPEEAAYAYNQVNGEVQRAQQDMSQVGPSDYGVENYTPPDLLTQLRNERNGADAYGGILPGLAGIAGSLAGDVVGGLPDAPVFGIPGAPSFKDTANAFGELPVPQALSGYAGESYTGDSRSTIPLSEMLGAAVPWGKQGKEIAGDVAQYAQNLTPGLNQLLPDSFGRGIAASFVPGKQWELLAEAAPGFGDVRGGLSLAKDAATQGLDVAMRNAFMGAAAEAVPRLAGEDVANAARRMVTEVPASEYGRYSDTAGLISGVRGASGDEPLGSILSHAGDYKKADLVEIADRFGVDTKGTKGDIINRLQDAWESGKQAAPTDLPGVTDADVRAVRAEVARVLDTQEPLPSEYKATIESIVNDKLGGDPEVTLYRGLNPERNAIASDAGDVGRYWSSDRSVAEQYAGPQGQVLEARLKASELADPQLSTASAGGEWRLGPELQARVSESIPAGGEPMRVALDDAQRAADSMSWQKFERSQVTADYVGSLSPVERREYSAIYDAVRTGLNTESDPAQLGAWRALADELQRTPYQVARGEMSVSEAQTVNRFIFDNHIGGLTNDTLNKLLNSPDFDALRPSSRALLLDAMTRQEASKAASVADVEKIVNLDSFKAARSEALKQADAVAHDPNVPEWVAQRMAGMPVDVPMDVRQSVITEAKRLGLHIDEQQVLRGTYDAVTEIMKQVDVALETERRLMLGERGRGIEDLAAAIKSQDADLEAKVVRIGQQVRREEELAKQYAWERMAGGSATGLTPGERLAGTRQELWRETGGIRPSATAARANLTDSERAVLGRNTPLSAMRQPGPAKAAAGGAAGTATREGFYDRVVNPIINAAFLPFGFDFSGLLRQLGPITLNPLGWTRGVSQSVIANALRGVVLTDTEYRTFLKDMLDNSIAVTQKGVKFDIPNVGGIASREGPFISRYIENIPGARRFENSYNLSLASGRILMTDAAVRNMPNLSPAQAQTIANFWARFTGRGSFGPADKAAARALGPLFTSARNIISIPETLAYLSPVTRLADGSFDLFGPVWREAVKAQAGYFATVLTILAAADANGVNVGWDPRDWASFLRMDVGTPKNPEKIDLLGNWRGEASALITALSGQRIVGGQLRTDYPAIIGQGKYGYEGAVAEFLRNHIGPALQVGFYGAQKAGVQGKAIDFLRPDYFNDGAFGLTGAVGKPLDEALQFVVPLWIQDVASAVRSAAPGQGLQRGLVAGLSAFGAGVSSYEKTGTSARAIDREGLTKQMIEGGRLPGVAAGTPYAALTPDEKGRVTAEWAAAHPTEAGAIAAKARAEGDVFQQTRDMKAAGDEAKAKAIGTLQQSWQDGEIKPRDMKQLLQDVRGAYSDVINGSPDKGVVGLYDQPAYKQAVNELESALASERTPGNFLTDIGKQLHGETPGQPLPQPGIITDLVDAYYKIPEFFTDAKGKVDWDAAREMQATFISGLKGVDEQVAARLESNVEPGKAQPLEQLYFLYLNASSEYYAQVPAGAPDTAATWYQYQYPWLLQHPDQEALLWMFGGRNDVATKEAADVVHQVAPGQTVNIKTYR